jgi:glucose/arabinose dehydrogenase
MKYSRLFIVAGFLFLNCFNRAVAQKNLSLIHLPEGFQIQYYYENVPNARSMCYEDSVLFVGTRKGGGKVYAIVDTNRDYHGDILYVLAEGLFQPNGVAFRDGDLYVAEINRIIKFPDILQHLDNPPDPVVIRDDLPDKKHHGWKFIRFGPDGKLYVPIGAPCNVCLEQDRRFATICRINPDGSQFEIFAEGVRNTVGFDWHPVTKELWFTDNGRDWMGDNLPPDELNRASQKGLHFGFPFCHGGDIPDPEYGKDVDCFKFEPPAMKLGPHVAALGMRFYTGNMFPEEYKNQIFIAEHGSWNRSKKIGYRISLVRLNGNQAVSYEIFAEGWLKGQKAWGRPVDIEILPDGSMLISDDKKGTIYRIIYNPKN